MRQHWYIGFDSTEEQAYQVCRHSLARHATCDLKITPIKHRAMRKAGLFWREWRMDGNGQWWDQEDGRPFSTEFAFTRFLTHRLALRHGAADWAFFVDCDFLFLNDVAELQRELDYRMAVMCVKHDFRPSYQLKMDGQMQVSYRRKNWSSLMAFNMSHEANNRLTPECVNKADGAWLHQMQWLEDDQIGELSPGWNWLVGHSSEGVQQHALHYTDGGPWIEGWEPRLYDDFWLAEADRLKQPQKAAMLELMRTPI